MGYRNETEQLCSVYESTGKLEDYQAANEAFEKLIAGGGYTNDDLVSYAYLQDLHSQYYVKKAVGLYNRVIDENESSRDHAYYKAHSQLILLLGRNNRSHESIDRYKKMVKDEPDNYHSYLLLERAYHWAKQYDDAWLALQAALKFRPDDAALLDEAGWLCKSMGKDQEAIAYFNKSYALNNTVADSLYGKACLYMDTGRTEEAITAWKEVVSWLEAHDLTEGTAWPKQEIAKLEAKLHH